MASSSRSSPGVISAQPVPYRIHISQTYLLLTKQKLEITRIPRDPSRSAGQGYDKRAYGVDKSDMEPLIDHWAEGYDWRAQEMFFNDTLPQFRVGINGVRLHFVHRRSSAPNAIPLLVVHGWPESFMAVSRMIDALCDPSTTPSSGNKSAPSFHVVVPSIPGTGFSDNPPEYGNNIGTTAEMFDALMKTLGYNQYIAHGSGWGFQICRTIALTHQESCLAIHTTNPEVPPPESGYGNASEELAKPGPMGHVMRAAPLGNMFGFGRAQTMAYALCDSPTGLLAIICDAIQPPRRTTPSSPQSFRSTSHASPSPATDSTGIDHPWTPTDLVNWTMVHWLSGPEASLRWLHNSAGLASALWVGYSHVPLGITQFMEPNTPQTPPHWLEGYHRVVMVKTRAGLSRFPSWERPHELVSDIRDLAIGLSPTISQSSAVVNMD